MRLANCEYPLRYATTPKVMAAQLVLAPQDDGSATPALARSRRRA
jgi:hypothetical protein